MSDTQKNIIIIEATFYDEISKMLSDNVIKTLEEYGYNYKKYSVPGAFEIPAALNFFIDSDKSSNNIDGYITLGCVIRGETTHYDYVCQESARALQDLAINHNLALGYGILTCENYDQAIARAHQDKKNKGREVAKACIEMISLKKELKIQ